MNIKIPFSKLEQTCSMCPSQWEYFDLESCRGVYIRYRHNNLAVYANREPVEKLFDCIDNDHLVLYIERLSEDSKDVDCGYLTNHQLFSILKQHNLLEE